MKQRTAGFTLVELLLALVITSILVVLLVNVVSAALNIWQQGRNQIDTLANARQVLGRIADELQGASAATNQIEFSENLTVTPFTTGGPTPTPNPQPTPQQGRSENIFFVAPYPNSAPGDLCVIAYRHIDIDQNPEPNNSHTLQRAFLHSQNAWNGGAVTRYRSNGYTAFEWRTIARGVLEFEIRSFSQQDLDSAGSPTPTPTPTLPDWNSVSGTSAMLGNTPRQVVIRMKVIDDKALARIGTLLPGNAQYDRVVNQSSRDFSVTVNLLPAH
jgi:prepilin-type N-terminal cleavage/methylation domain-containing protein